MDKVTGNGPRLIVLTGMSGAGKQLASRYFEDMKWRVVDNLPPRLLPDLVRVESGNDTPLCAVCDVRGGHLPDLIPTLDRLEASGFPATVLFLEAADEALVRRFKETRRPHPLFESTGGIFPAIAAERELLFGLRGRADIILDTTEFSSQDLRQALLDAFAATGELRQHPLTVTVVSFGFKHGMPLDADLLFDVRFLNNPHYEDTLRPHDGRNPDVESFVMADERTGAFLERLYDLVGWSLPHYITEGKAYLTVGIGCTGGRHRSVVVAEKLGKFLKDRGYRTLIQHRDLKREGKA